MKTLWNLFKEIRLVRTLKVKSDIQSLLRMFAQNQMDCKGTQVLIECFLAQSLWFYIRFISGFKEINVVWHFHVTAEKASQHSSRLADLWPKYVTSDLFHCTMTYWVLVYDVSVASVSTFRDTVTFLTDHFN